MDIILRENSDLTKPIKRPKKPRKPMKQQGKHFQLWNEARHKWIQENANKYNTWSCHLQISPWCPRLLTLETLTLDHLHTRSSRPDLRYDQKNLAPCCRFCNGLRGSKKLDKVKPQA